MRRRRRSRFGIRKKRRVRRYRSYGSSRGGIRL